MKTVNTIYTNLRTLVGAYYEVQVSCNNIEYGIDRLKSVTIHSALYDGSGVSVGNAYSSYCNITVMEASSNWPRMAQFTVRVRLSNADGRRKSDWLDMGTFYTDERSEDTYGNLNITGYDRMLMTEQYWTDKIPEQQMTSEWPITSRAWVNLMESAGLIEVDPETVLDNSVHLIGLNTASTIRDKLKDIAAAHGGNWVVTPEGKLKLVYFRNIADGQASTDLIPLGMNVQRFESSPALDAISGVNLETEDGTAASAGNTSWYILNGKCEFANTEGVADLCLTNVGGYIYKPFAAEKALLDPVAEVGDLVTIDGRNYQIITIDWNLSTWPTADISAPYEAEVDHEYQIVNPEAKSYRKAVASTDTKLKNYAQISEFGTLIEQNSNSVVLAASQTYVNITNYNETIQNLQNQISGAITQYSGDPVPTLSNEPAVDWDPADYNQHVGALYLVTAGDYKGQYYRFEKSGNTFNWVLVEDSALAKALSDAAAAQKAAADAIAEAEAASQAAAAAQGTADEAKTDATQKAAEAAAAAAAAAAVDATNKANAALEAAKKFANDQLINFIDGDYYDDLESIRGQIDRKIETYYQTADPSKSWPEEEKADHFGDLWYNMGDQRYYRWDGTGWEEMTANPPQTVFDTLDGKARVFVSTPVPPYSVGDIWTQGPNGDILRCVQARAEGEQYVTSEDWILASKYTDDSNLEAFISGRFAEMVDTIKNQIDQKAATYYQPNNPAADENGKTRWNTIAGIAIAGLAIVGSTNSEHTGDLWYNTSDDTTWYWDGTQWVEQTISREVFDTIDGKAQIFVSQPSKDDDYYEPGDIWVNATYSDGNVSYNNDILRCIQGKAKGEPFSIGDWQLASKYTDDSALSTFLDGYNGTLSTIRGQIDQKAQTWYQSDDPATAWNTIPLKEQHVGDLWYRTSDNTTWQYKTQRVPHIIIVDGYEQIYFTTEYVWLEQAAPKAVFDAIDGKRQIFTSQPEDTDEYDEGDLWVNATYGTTYSNDLLRCRTGKAKNAAFSISHWELASKYTDDTAVEELVVGGTNLLPDSNVPSLTKVYGTVNRYISDSGNSSYVTGESIEVTDAPVAGIKYGFRFICSNASTTATQRGYAWNNTETKIQLQPGEKYTVSCYVRKVSGNPKFSQRYGYYTSSWKYVSSTPEEIINTDWEQRSWTFTYPSNATSRSLRLYAAQMICNSIGVMEVCGFKLEKGSKATDWTQSPNDIEAGIDGLKETVEAKFDVATDQINARVTRTGNNEAKSFGWSLTEEAHVWKKKASGVETEVLRIDGTGLHVNGDGTFSGTVSAATITGSTISGGSITGTKINIGPYTDSDGNTRYKFSVNANGDLTATSGTFTGSVYAKNVLSGNSTYGYFPGSGVSASGNFGSDYFTSGINNGPLAYANNYNAATQNGTSNFPSYFKARNIVCTSMFSGPSFYVDDGTEEGSKYYLNGHYHSISVANGKVTIGSPYNATKAPSFDINDLISSITPVFGA